MSYPSIPYPKRARFWQVRRRMRSDPRLQSFYFTFEGSFHVFAAHTQQAVDRKIERWIRRVRP